MIKHYIIMSSSYTDGTRVALDITDESLLNSEAIGAMLKEIKRICGEDVPLSTHLIETESTSWTSVAEYDPFFEGVVCTKSVAEFSEKIRKDRVLSGLEPAFQGRVLLNILAVLIQSGCTDAVQFTPGQHGL